jgi:hypothetical protein
MSVIADIMDIMIAIAVIGRSSAADLLAVGAFCMAREKGA